MSKMNKTPDFKMWRQNQTKLQTKAIREICFGNWLLQMEIHCGMAGPLGRMGIAWRYWMFSHLFGLNALLNIWHAKIVVRDRKENMELAVKIIVGLRDKQEDFT